MKKLAVCIATYQHPDIVLDVLTRSLEDYYRYDIDIYYYDSSENDETKKVIESFVKQGYDNLYYVKVECGFDKKIDLIYSGYGLEKEYDYIWPSKDRSYCPAQTLERIQVAMEEEHDFIMLGVVQNVETSDIIYEEPKGFYREWAWLATSLDVLIYKYSSTLKDYASESFNKLHPQKYIESWRVYVYVFCKLVECVNSSVKVLTGKEIALFNSLLGKSTWEKATFLIWKDYWIQANDDLPEHYNEYKAIVIKKAASLPWIMGGISRLMQLREIGALIPEKLESIEKNWERVSDIPIEKVRKIAWGIYDYYHDVEAIGKTGDEIVDVVMEVHKMLSEGKMEIDQLPIEEICTCVKMAFDNKYSAACKFRGIFEGTIQDIEENMKYGEIGKEAMCKLLQLLINILLLCKSGV